MRLIFVRHGEPNYKDDCLTDNGIIQAKATAERLRNENISAIYSSPMGRARQTASFTAEQKGLDINVLDYMHEIDWGDPNPDMVSEEDKLPHDGHPWTMAYMLITEHPEYSGNENWREHHYFKDNKCLKFYDMISEEFDLFLERFGIVRRDGLYFCEKENHDTIALFAHGGSGAIMFSHVLGLPFPFVLSNMPYGVCSVSIIDFSEFEGNYITPRIELFNDMDHLTIYKPEKMNFEK